MKRKHSDLKSKLKDVKDRLHAAPMLEDQVAVKRGLIDWCISKRADVT